MVNPVENIANDKSPLNRGRFDSATTSNELTQTIPSEINSLLATAETTLHLLERQAELARVEARRLELLAAIASARQGSPEPLRTWLQTNGNTIAVDAVATPAQSQWETIRLRSMQRLVRVQPSENASSPDSQSGTIELFPKANEAAQRIASTSSEPNTVTQAESTPKPAQVSTVTRIPAPQLAEPTTEFRRTKRRWQFSGVVVSTILHLLLIVGLGIITVSVPIDGSIFELQASEATEVAADSLEMSSEVDAEAPSEQFEMASSSSQPDLTQALSTQGEPSADALGDLAANSESSQLSNALAATASQSPKNLSASFYGASAAGNSFCFLIDGSGSLSGSPWEAARAELIKSLQSMSEKQRFYVIFYNKVISKVPDREIGKPARTLIYATHENLQHTARWLQSLRVDTAPPGGNHIPVLEAALELEPDAIFMLTDGGMTPGVERQVLEMLRRSNRITDIVEDEVIRTPIHTIAFHLVEGIEVMKKIAEQNNGQMTFIPKPPQIDGSRKRTGR